MGGGGQFIPQRRPFKNAFFLEDATKCIISLALQSIKLEFGFVAHGTRGKKIDFQAFVDSDDEAYQDLSANNCSKNRRVKFKENIQSSDEDSVSFQILIPGRGHYFRDLASDVHVSH